MSLDISTVHQDGGVLVRWNGITILIDCPARVVPSPQGCVWVETPFPPTLDPATIDVVLVSSPAAALGLPFFTLPEHGFRGQIFIPESGFELAIAALSRLLSLPPSLPSSYSTPAESARDPPASSDWYCHRPAPPSAVARALSLATPVPAGAPVWLSAPSEAATGAAPRASATDAGAAALVACAEEAGAGPGGVVWTLRLAAEPSEMGDRTGTWYDSLSCSQSSSL